VRLVGKVGQWVLLRLDPRTRLAAVLLRQCPDRPPAAELHHGGPGGAGVRNAQVDQIAVREPLAILLHKAGDRGANL
jgi:hypothetical protein